MRQAKAELKLRQEAQYAAEQAQVEAERIEKAKQAQLDAERITKAENDAQLEAARSAKAVLALQQELQLELLQKAEQTKLALEQANIVKAEKEIAEAVAKEAARLEMARIVDQAEEERKETESQLKAARQRAVRQLKTEEQARDKALRQAKKDEKQTHQAAKAAEKNKAVQQESIQLEINRLAHPAEDAKRNDEAANNNAKVAKQVAFVHHDAIPKLGNASKKITQQQDEPQANDGRQTATLQGTTADLEKQLTAQQAQEKAEQIRARNEADDKAALAEKALARQEMARIAREADALRSQANITSLTKPTKSGQFAASKSAQLKSANSKKSNKESQYKAAEKNAVNVADARVYEAEKRILIAIADRQIAAKLPAQIKVPTKIIRTPIDLSVRRLKCLMWLVKPLKITLTIGFISALFLIAALHFVNISPLIAPIEKLATLSFGSPVHITQVRASLWPQPQFTLGNVAIGDTLKVTSIQLVPEVGTLFDDVKHVKSAQIQGVTIDRNHLEASLNLIKQLKRAPTLQIAQLNVSNLRFKANDLVLGPFDGNLVLSAAGALTSVELHSIDSALNVQINPLGDDYAITLTGNHWPLPFKPSIVFETLKVGASLHQNKLTFNQIEGGMFGGNISATAALDWSDGWRANGKFKLTSANTPQLLTAFASKTNVKEKASVEGKLSMVGDFSSQSIEAFKLADATNIFANIMLKNGKINGVDLAKAVLNQSASLAGEATEFDTLSANLQVKNGQYHYKQILLNAKQFHANGDVNIDQNQLLTGRVRANLAAQSRRMQANFILGGTINQVKRQ